MQLARKHKLIIAAAAVLLMLVGGIWFYLFGTFWTYSASHNEGYIQNFGYKGSWISTWECDVALRGSVQGSQQIWECSVNDDAIRKQIQEIHSDQLVRIHYKKYKFVGAFSGKTQYIVRGVEVVNPINPEIERVLREFGSSYINTQDFKDFLAAQKQKWSSDLGHKQ